MKRTHEKEMRQAASRTKQKKQEGRHRTHSCSTRHTQKCTHFALRSLEASCSFKVRSRPFSCFFWRAPIGHEAPYYRMLDPRGRRQHLERWDGLPPFHVPSRPRERCPAARTSRRSPSYLTRIAANRESPNACNPREVGRTHSACP